MPGAHSVNLIVYCDVEVNGSASSGDVDEPADLVTACLDPIIFHALLQTI